MRTNMAMDGAGRRLAEASCPEAIEPAEAVPLSRIEAVLVRDAWNKFLPFDEMLAELFFERLLLECPELLEQFGPAVDHAGAEFLRLFDLAARSLDPRTEAGLRETYREAPGARHASCWTIEECAVFFSSYGLTAAHWEVAGRVFLWAFARAPYLEEYEKADLEAAEASALGRFFALHVAAPMVARVQEEEQTLAPDVIAEMQRGAERMLTRPREAGIFFYQTLFRTFPDVLRHFRTADMDQLSRHLIEAVVFLSRAAGRPESLRTELRNLAAVHLANQIPAADYPRLAGPLLQTLARFGEPLSIRTHRAWEVLFGRVIRIISKPMAEQERLTAAAREFLEQVALELDWSASRLERRWAEILHEVRATGTYTQTFEELEHGARLAWRNAPKCIGRISWRNLVVRDRRHVHEPDEIFEECRRHLEEATSGGNIEIVMTVFRPTRSQERWGPRIWNSQFVRYAGYALPDGSVLGDRANVGLTAAIERLGWQPPATRSAQDVLPLVIDVPGHEPQIRAFAPEEVLEVPITHPTVPGFAALGLKWCAVPAIANFRLLIGGIDYGCVPFNGWFMGTEIARNIFEEKRYDRAADIAACLGLDTSSEATLWRDRAFLELNTAIIHSFAAARVTLVDHQTASRQFMIHDLREKRAGRECPAQWSWIAPAAGGSTCPVWHHEMRDFHLDPAFVYAADRWMVLDQDIAPSPAAQAGAAAGVRRPLIVYASETGTAEACARKAGRRLAALGPRVVAAEEVDIELLHRSGPALLVVSTCRDGEIPASGKALAAALEAAAGTGALAGVSFAVLGLGNRIYPRFCAAAHVFDDALEAAGATRLSALETADEIAGQTETVKHWLDMFAKLWQVDGHEVRARRGVVELIPPARAAAPTEPGARVASNSEMLGPEAGDTRSTRLVALDLDPGQPDYEAGDHVAILPENPPALVEAMLRHLGLPHDAWVRILGGRAGASGRYREGVSVQALLVEDLDFAMPEAPEELFAAMRSASRDPDDREQLGRWLETLDLAEDDPTRQALRGRLERTYLSVVDLFDAFPGSVPGLETLVELLPHIRPRLYSIGSSPLVHPRQVRVMVSVVSRPVGDGRLRQGLCSHYLKGLVPGDRVRAAIKPAPRRLRPGFEGPLVLVGAGTGFSPLFGLLQDREARGVPAGVPTRLYFGCRGEAEILERARLVGWRRQGLLDCATVAFSRQGPAKAYVQDALDADGARLAQVLALPDAHLVICGDAKMAQDVVDVLLRLLQREAGLGYPEAVSFIETLRGEGRLIEDVWGVQLNREVALPEMIASKYNSGATWFSRLQRAMGSAPAERSSLLDL